MSERHDFDELIGAEPQGPERERLRRTHDLLLAAGPPPELAPELEAGPTLAMTLGRPPRHMKRRLALIAAAIVAVAVVFLGGYIAGNRNSAAPTTPNAARVLELQGTALAPNALATLHVRPRDDAGNWPMTLDANGLPALPDEGYYAVYVVRNGKPWKPCGWFTVNGPHDGVSVPLNAPWQLEQSDRWVVTRQLPGTHGAGETVMQEPSP
jgi:hypothetical protein